MHGAYQVEGILQVQEEGTLVEDSPRERDNLRDGNFEVKAYLS